jgi:hypothetical protein
VAREALSASLDGERQHVPTARVDAHVEPCSSCRQWLAEAAALRRRTRQVGLSTGPDLSPRIVAAADALGGAQLGRFSASQRERRGWALTLIPPRPIPPARRGDRPPKVARCRACRAARRPQQAHTRANPLHRPGEACWFRRDKRRQVRWPQAVRGPSGTSGRRVRPHVFIALGLGRVS